MRYPKNHHAVLKASIHIALLVFLTWRLVEGADQVHIYPSNPVIQHDAAYISSNGITRFDRKTLKPVWQALTGITTFEPVVTHNAVLVATTRGLYALDPAKGNTLWHLASDETLFAPAIMQAVAFVGGVDGSLRAVKLDSGRILWRREFGGWLYTPAIVNNQLVVGGREDILRGIDAVTGDVLWTKTLDQELVYRPVEASHDGVVVTLFNGKILMVSPKDGITHWQAQEQTPSFSPAISRGRLYFGTFGGYVKARSVLDGRIIWEQQMNGKLRFLPQVVNNVVLMGSDQGEIAAYDIDTGARLWLHRLPHELIASPVAINNAVIGFTSNTDLFLRRVHFLDSEPENVP